MDLGVVGDFVGEASASASSLWLGSVSDSSLTDTSEPARNREPLTPSAHILVLPHFLKCDPFQLWMQPPCVGKAQSSAVSAGYFGIWFLI